MTCYFKGNAEQVSDAGQWIKAGLDRENERFAAYEANTELPPEEGETILNGESPATP